LTNEFDSTAGWKHRELVKRLILKVLIARFKTVNGETRQLFSLCELKFAPDIGNNYGGVAGYSGLLSGYSVSF
jgi:hypothetical protein